MYRNNIQKAEIEDLVEILSLQKKAFTEVAKLMNKFDLPPLLQTIEEVRNEYKQGILLKYLSKENKIIGSVRGFSDENNICHIGKLVVDPDYQNQGIGKILLSEIEKRFLSCDTFALFTGDETPNTLFLYKKIGYRVIGKQNKGTINMFLMEKNNSRKNFATPPDHVNFLAKKLFDNSGDIVNGSIAYLEPDGGGPLELHTHEYDHLFIVVKGEARVKFENHVEIISENQSCLVKGSIPHSVWNNITETTTMIGITIKRK